MPKYLTALEAYRIIQRELPEGVYADGAPSAFFSTADTYSTAKTVETLYSNLSRIYANNFPQDTVERIGDWEDFVFGFRQNSSVPLSSRIERVLAKIRKKPAITAWEILTLVASYLPQGKYVQVYAPCGGGTLQWELGFSMLGIDTFLKGVTFDSLGVSAETWCEEVANIHWRLGQDQLGINTFLAEFLYTDIALIQADAYLYEIRIFDYTFSANDLAALDVEISAAEPARSTHKITQGLALNDYGLINTVNNVDQFSLVDCITRDPLSTTGYTGKTT